MHRSFSLQSFASKQTYSIRYWVVGMGDFFSNQFVVRIGFFLSGLVILALFFWYGKWVFHHRSFFLSIGVIVYFRWNVNASIITDGLVGKAKIFRSEEKNGKR